MYRMLDVTARTATARDSRPTVHLAHGAVLDKYRLERELGMGGMGIVYAAFDTELERRVALKLLHDGHAVGAGRRLLREARAMARLAHPNVVTVYEAGSVDGRDFVAMELVDGEPLVAWLRAKRRPTAAIIAAFVDAGRGLAAAHAAGIVHRDFKPHNVLRSRSGRIAVTDFGLARDVDGDAASSLALPTAMSSLTGTGCRLGTPAYMAPEQWDGGPITPKTDQFSFCVAVWEALTGERPFRGDTVEELAAHAGRGPDGRDATKLPRRVRAILQRGLDPIPARRWPSMDALLAKLATVQRRPLAITSAVAVAALIAIVATPTARPRGDDLEQPAIDPVAVWSPLAHANLASRGNAGAARAITDVVERWQARHELVRADRSAIGALRRSCLDAVLVRAEVVARAVATMPERELVVSPFLLDPKLCDGERPPLLVPSTSPAFREAIATRIRHVVGDVTASGYDQLLARIADDPCAAAQARLGLATTHIADDAGERDLAAATGDAERCGDDSIRAEIAVIDAAYSAARQLRGHALAAKLELAAAAIQRVSQPDLVAVLELVRMAIAARDGDIESAIRNVNRAIVMLDAPDRASKQLALQIQIIELRTERSDPSDLVAIEPALAELRAYAISRFGAGNPAIAQLDTQLAHWRFANGDVAAAHAQLAKLRREQPNTRARRLAGRVVDARGRGVAGAVVAVDTMVAGNAVGAAMGTSPSLRFATTGADGAFAIADAPVDSVAIAQLGSLRSRPRAVTDRVTLMLEPTSRIAGRAELRGNPAVKFMIRITDRTARSPGYELIAPVHADGTYSLDGVPRGPVEVELVTTRALTFASTTKVVDVRRPVVDGIDLAVADAGRRIHAIVRSTASVPVPNALVVVIPGTVKSMKLGEMQRLQMAGASSGGFAREADRASVPAGIAFESGDLYVAIANAPTGIASACAIGLARLDATLIETTTQAAGERVDVKCVQLDPAATTVTIEVPPLPRLDQPRVHSLR